MKRSSTLPLSRVVPLVMKATALLLPTGYAGVLLWQQWTWRQTFPDPISLLVSASPDTQKSAVFDPDGMASVLDLTTRGNLVRSTEALVLRASFVSNAGDSRALLADGEGQHSYREGDTLPGGSVLRRIETSRAVLWRNGREELLPLDIFDEHSLLSLKPSTSTGLTKPTSFYLQSTTGQAPSD